MKVMASQDFSRQRLPLMMFSEKHRIALSRDARAKVAPV